MLATGADVFPLLCWDSARFTSYALILMYFRYVGYILLILRCEALSGVYSCSAGHDILWFYGTSNFQCRVHKTLNWSLLNSTILSVSLCVVVVR